MKKTLIVLLYLASFSSTQTVIAAPDTRTSNTALEYFDIVNIKQGDSLRMWSWPSLTSKIVVAIPHNAQSIIYKGNIVRQGNKTWKQVYWNNNKGWVDAKHLQHHVGKTIKTPQPVQVVLPASPLNSHILPQTIETIASINHNEKKAVLACGGSKPFWNIHMGLTSKKILVNLQDGHSFTTSLNSRKWNKNNNEMLITGGQNEQAIKATLYKTNTCMDGLTTRKYPFTVNVTIGDKKKISGCCRAVAK